ncbi:MAG: hypothetical protein NT018_10520 [Armatimonadetes bacterium]|nr:hypothetical protein [Armatimonadota bacterium]
MNNNRIEELLRDAWQPEPPDGMKGRTLSRAQSELTKRRWQVRFSKANKWQVALAAVCVAVVIFTNIDCSRREERLALMIGGQSAMGPQTRIARSFSAEEWGRMQSEMMAKLSSDMKGDNP